MSEQRAEQRDLSRIGPLFAAIWLLFLVDPLLEAWGERDTVAGVVGLLATIAFGVVYMGLWLRMRAHRARLVESPPYRLTIPYLVGQVVLGAVMIATIGESGTACLVYIAVSVVMVLPLRAAAPIVVLIMIGSLSLGAVEGWGSKVSVTFGIMAAAVAVLGIRTVMRRNIDLLLAEQENASLAVENERSRFARDLHDILGHSLTVITVKAELAQRLLDQDSPEAVERARHELADLERLSRDALADVRRAVEGYRELTLPGELARARTALSAAEIEAHLPNSADDVPTDLRELFAWTVREGVTNVIRHSGARTCQVALSPTSAEVRDDGCGPTQPGHGSGLAGLRERAAAVGAAVVTEQLDPGFVLRVVRS